MIEIITISQVDQALLSELQALAEVSAGRVKVAQTTQITVQGELLSNLVRRIIGVRPDEQVAPVQPAETVVKTVLPETPKIKKEKSATSHAKAPAQPLTEQTCTICGAKYMPVNSHQKTCLSAACTKAKSRQYANDWYQKNVAKKGGSIRPPYTPPEIRDDGAGETPADASPLLG